MNINIKIARELISIAKALQTVLGTYYTYPNIKDPDLDRRLTNKDTMQINHLYRTLQNALAAAQDGDKDGLIMQLQGIDDNDQLIDKMPTQISVPIFQLIDKLKDAKKRGIQFLIDVGEDNESYETLRLLNDFQSKFDFV